MSLLLQQLQNILRGWRIGRVIMLSLATGSVAYGLGGSWRQVGLAALIGACLSTGGFYLDHLGDLKKDRDSGKTENPFARGALSLLAGIFIVTICYGIVVVLGILVNPWILVPSAGVILVVGGLAVGTLDTPLLRAFSLGFLQGLYVLIGGLAAYRFELGLLLLALFLFFGMTGARAVGDIRDLHHDQRASLMTLPRKYGIRWTGYFLLVNEIIAYLFGLSVYLTGILRIEYLYCMIGIVLTGLPLNFIFIAKTNPKTGRIINVLSLSFLGSLFVLGMIVGRL